MANFMYEGVNVFNPIEGKMDYFVNAFTNIYGEKYRDKINIALNDATYLFVTDDEYSRLGRVYSAKLNYETKKQIEKYLKENKILSARNLLHGLFNENEDLGALCRKDDEVLKGFGALLKRIRLIDDINREKVINFFEDKSHTHLFLEYYNSVVSDISKIKEKCYENYKFEMEILSEMSEIVDTKKRNLLADRFKFAKDELEEICLKNKLNFDKTKLDEMTYVFIDLLTIGEKVAINGAGKFNKFYKKRFCELFEYMGFGKRKNLKEYLTDALVIKNAFGKADFYKFILEMQRLNMGESDEFYKLFKSKIEGYAKSVGVDSRGLVYYFNAYFYGAGNVEAYVHRIATKEGRKSLCVCRNALRLSKNALIHEMGHLLEGGQFTKQGMKIANDMGYDFEMLNEVFNDYLTNKVVAEFEKNNIKVAFLKDKKCAYTPAISVFKIFFKTFESELIEFKMSDYHEQFLKYFGKENLEELENIAKIVVKKYGEKIPEQDYDNITILKAKNKVIKICNRIKKETRKNIKQTNYNIEK